MEAFSVLVFSAVSDGEVVFCFFEAFGTFFFGEGAFSGCEDSVASGIGRVCCCFELFRAFFLGAAGASAGFFTVGRPGLLLGGSGASTSPFFDEGRRAFFLGRISSEMLVVFLLFPLPGKLFEATELMVSLGVEAVASSSEDEDRCRLESSLLECGIGDPGLVGGNETGEVGEDSCGPGEAGADVLEDFSFAGLRTRHIGNFFGLPRFRF